MTPLKGKTLSSCCLTIWEKISKTRVFLVCAWNHHFPEQMKLAEVTCSRWQVRSQKSPSSQQFDIWGVETLLHGNVSRFSSVSSKQQQSVLLHLLPVKPETQSEVKESRKCSWQHDLLKQLILKDWQSCLVFFFNAASVWKLHLQPKLGESV